MRTLDVSKVFLKKRVVQNIGDPQGPHGYLRTNGL